MVFSPKGSQRIPRRTETTSCVGAVGMEMDIGAGQSPRHDEIQDPTVVRNGAHSIEATQSPDGAELPGRDSLPEHGQRTCTIDAARQWDGLPSRQERIGPATQNQHCFPQDSDPMAPPGDLHHREESLEPHLTDSIVPTSPRTLARASFAESPHVPSDSMTVTSLVYSPTVSPSAAEGLQGYYVVEGPRVGSRDLPSQLHDHIFQTTGRLTSRWLSMPERDLPASETDPATCTRSEGDGDRILTTSPRSSEIQDPYVPSQERTHELWQNYLQEVAPWLDMFDHESHWRTSVAYMSRRAECLHYSLLALSARQQERKRGSHPYTESLKLYQQAIRLITAELSTVSTEVIAACILLCVLEMMGSSPEVWTKHLSGCVMLLRAGGLTATEGGVRQALFLTVARMDVYLAFIGDTMTKSLTYPWFMSEDSMNAALAPLRSRRSCDGYANYVVVLNAGVVHLLADGRSAQPRFDPDSPSYVSRWNALFDLLEEWYDDRPDMMRPLMEARPTDPLTHGDLDTIMFTTPPGICGNQLYHFAVIFLLQNKPKDVRRAHRSILWHARQICGIAISNSDNGSRIHALQSILTAGKVMSHRCEHRVILDLLRRLEADTGWATEWCQEELQQHWGLP